MGSGRWRSEASGAQILERSRELLTEPPVLFGELPVPPVGGFESLEQRGFGCSLPRWYYCRRRGEGLLAESFNLGSQIRLGV
ncbi:hypothetical protein GCM10022224_035460 [Nonomuraea antimicrobica]|uniref:Uncharacterized protein n=1 Tax=Nonomuraea antimicrobica TaxID=561173 RepID=A0ABP7BRX8_9ACTN